MNVGVIGLGQMGGRMVPAFIECGHRVVAYDLSSSATERAIVAGAAAAVSAAAVGAAAEIVLLSLPLPAHVEAVVAGEAGILAHPTAGLVIVDTSTVDPGTTRRLAARAAAVGVGYLDAPVLGRPAACGAWTLPVGGDGAALDAARPVLEAIARSVVHVGGSGAGNALKLLNTLMFGAINAITAEVLAVAPHVGVSPRAFYEAVAGSQAATVSPLFRELGPKILDRDFSPVFTLDLLRKDNALALAMIDDTGASSIVGGVVTALNGLGCALGHGAEDTSAMVKVYETLLRPEAASPE